MVVVVVDVLEVVLELVVDDLEVVCEVVLDVVEDDDVEWEVVVDEEEEEELIELLVELDVDEVLDEVEEVEEVEDAAGLMASAITPKSLPWVVPNDRVAPDMDAESTSY